MSNKSLFDILKDLTWNKAEYDSNNSYSKYMINRYVSMCEAYIPLVNEVNKANIPDNIHYNYFKLLLPKRNVYLKYIGKQKQDDESKILLECIETYFKVGKKDAEAYCDFLSDDDKDELISYYYPEIKKSAANKKASGKPARKTADKNS